LEVLSLVFFSLYFHLSIPICMFASTLTPDGWSTVTSLYISLDVLSPSSFVINCLLGARIQRRHHLHASVMSRREIWEAKLFVWATLHILTCHRTVEEDIMMHFVCGQVYPARVFFFSHQAFSGSDAHCLWAVVFQFCLLPWLEGDSFMF